MADPKFTPGPWEVRRSAHRHDGEYDFAISAPGALVLAESFGRDAVGRRPPAGANARLIAAAPQMYEALKAAMAFINSHVADPDITTEMAANWAALMGTQPNEVLSAAVGEDA